MILSGSRRDLRMISAPVFSSPVSLSPSIALPAFTRAAPPPMMMPSATAALVALTASSTPVSYTHLRAHETRHDIVCRLLLEKNKQILGIVDTSNNTGSTTDRPPNDERRH